MKKGLRNGLGIGAFVVLAAGATYCVNKYFEYKCIADNCCGKEVKETPCPEVKEPEKHYRPPHFHHNPRADNPSNSNLEKTVNETIKSNNNTVVQDFSSYSSSNNQNNDNTDGILVKKGEPVDGHLYQIKGETIPRLARGYTGNVSKNCNLSRKEKRKLVENKTLYDFILINSDGKLDSNDPLSVEAWNEFVRDKKVTDKGYMTSDTYKSVYGSKN